MKRIRSLRDRTPGLTDYLEVETQRASWEGFRSHDGGRAYREVVETLTNLQRGLCGYCEIRLTEVDRQVEHVVPQSHPRRGTLLALAVENLMACCKGGTAYRDDPDRYWKPVKQNRSCGEAKGDRADSEFMDPRALPEFPSLIRVLDDGQVEADPEACGSEGMSATSVTLTIELLNLNARRLRVARAKRWRALNDEWGERLADTEEMQRAARIEVLPVDGRLPEFFTTSRSYFGPAAERVLQEQPRTWV